MTVALRSKVMDLAEVLKAMPERHIEIPIKHYFSTGIYMRQMTMTEGSTVVGKIHKTEHMCVLAKGSVTVVNGTDRNTYHAPSVVKSMPGTQRALHAHSEVVWINVHHNPENISDLEKIDDHFVVETHEQYLEFTEQKKIEGGT